MMWATLGTVFLIYEAAILCLLITRDGAREPVPTPDPEDGIRTVVLARIILPPRERSAADHLRDHWVRKAHEVVAQDSTRWPHLMPAWKDEPGSFRRAILEEPPRMAVAA